MEQNNLSIPAEIIIADGIYHLSSYNKQDYHDDICKSEHDPCHSCTARKIVKSNVNIQSNHTINEQTTIRSGTCMEQLKFQEAMLSGLVGSVEYISPAPRRHADSASRPGVPDQS